MGCMEKLGVSYQRIAENEFCVASPGLLGFSLPKTPLDCGNSGTTMRLLAGILAGSRISATLVGDESLMRRPMQRIVEPLCAMGAEVTASSLGRAPLTIKGRLLKGIVWEPEVASAQVKSAILLAGLNATGQTEVLEILPTRDHTERMLKAVGADIEYGSGYARVWGCSDFKPAAIEVPGDISSAAFFMTLSAVLPGSLLTVNNVGLNYGRRGILEVLEQMGAKVSQSPAHGKVEPTGTLEIRGGELRAFEISGEIVPRLIDEIPVLAVAACFAQGRSVVRDAAELRAKESDRISLLLKELTKMGARCEEFSDGFAIEGCKLQGAEVDAHGDHRLAMALAVAGCVAEGETVLRGAGCVDVSYPRFWDDLAMLRGETNG